MQLTRIVRKAACVVLLLCCGVFAGIVPFASAQTNSDVPTKTDVQNQINTLNKQKDLSAEEKLSLADLNKTLDVLAKIDQVKQDADALRQQIAQAPDKMNKAEESLAALANTSSDEDQAKYYAKLSMRSLESKMGSLLDNLQSAQTQLSSINSQLVALQTQPERVQNALFNASQQLQQIQAELGGNSPDGTQLRQTQQGLLLAQQALLNAQIDEQRKSLSGNTVLQDSLQKQRDYNTQYINKLQHDLQLIQTAISHKRLSLTEQTAQEAATTDEASVIQNNPLVKQELAINRQLSDRLIKATQEGNELVQQNIRVKNWLDRAVQAEHNLKEQIAMLKGSLLLSRILYQQQQSLPRADDLEDMTNQIADLRLEQFDVGQKRDALLQSDNYIATIEAGHKDEVSDEVNDALSQVLDSRKDLLDQLNKQLGNQLMMAIALQINQQQLMSVSTRLQKTVTQQIFWVNSNKPMNWSWVTAFPEALKTQLGQLKITASNWNLTTVLVALLASLPWLLLAGIIRWRFRWVNNTLAKLSANVGQLRNDSQLHTPKAILLTLFKALPLCLVIIACGWCILFLQLNISELIWSFSKELAVYLLVFGLSWRILDTDGVAVKHFMMPVNLTSHYRRQIIRISIALLPLLFWSVVGELSPLHLMDDVLGQSIILLNLLLIAGLVWPMCRDSWRDKESHSIRLITVSILALVPIGLLVLTVMGYFYTTLRLANRWIDTVYLVILWNLLYQTVLRGLSVAARRIAYRRALARRQNMVKEGAEGAEPVEEPPLGLDQINQQTLRITTLLMFALFGLLFWMIWSDLITVFAYLDSIVLWHSSGTEAGSAVIRNVTLGSLLFAVIATVVAWALIRNLPGLLEVLVLSRLNMRQGSSYAITTILNYIIIAVGTMSVFGALGVSWDKLQWLAAALSVGLGFGLQEIFGNFVSGLIILFERPVRIGDTITIGSFSGSVSKIRIRATTITDFDRKEVIIPNKAFVTERLINWSLSDTITRVVISLGVAYGSDLDKVKAVLLQAAMEHPKVMRDPEPAVFFTTFGASTLDHELRLYVRELRDRSYTVDELNRAIDRLCRENGIEIAFNQLDVHLYNNNGDTVTEVSRSLDNNEPKNSTPGPVQNN
ncbi:mechanosensitive channel MscK [Mangrovibacter yixingensis]|uniref:mechanosensitive channel MscK n=1 Tax=Mangrovibacter yixingensis TaxID=1529639 RepID=UPI001CF9401A|nr:mechanosensitive channel MscK [Mangrovibacter yixingensis]